MNAPKVYQSTSLVAPLNQDISAVLVQSLTSATGLGLVGWGTSSGIAPITAVGGTLVGMGLSGLVNSQIIKNRLLRYTQLLEAASRPHLWTESTLLNRFRTRLYVYDISMIDGEPRWLCKRIDLSDSPEGPILEGTMHIETGSKRGSYNCEFAMRGKTLLMLRQSNDGQEEASTSFFPTAADQFDDFHSGYAQKISFDRTRDLVPAIMSVGQPIAEITTPGRVDEASAERLWRKWRTDILRQTSRPVFSEDPQAVTSVITGAGDSADGLAEG